MTDFRNRYLRVKVAERLAKDDIAIVDLQDAIVKQSHTGYSTTADVENKVAQEVRTAVANASAAGVATPTTPAWARSQPPLPDPALSEKLRKEAVIAAVSNNRITDRGVMLLAYGALKNMKREDKKAVAAILRSHLYPHHEPSSK